MPSYRPARVQAASTEELQRSTARSINPAPKSHWLKQLAFSVQKKDLLVFALKCAATLSFRCTQMRQKLIKCCPMRLNTQ